MSSSGQSNMFKYNFICWKVFGIWPGIIGHKYYKYYSFMYLFITLFLYNVLLTINLLYTPPKIELLIREVIFYFTEMAVAAKVFTVLIMRDKIILAFNLLDSVEFQGDCETTKEMVATTKANYITFYKLYQIVSNVTFSTQVFVPIFISLIYPTVSDKELPICKYYFLSEEVRQTYFVYWFIYQSFGMYGHMMYNVNTDSFIAGLLVLAITQVKILKFELVSLVLSREERRMPVGTQDAVQMLRLNGYLKHYDLILEYCSTVQKILSVTLFVQFGIASTIICVVMCGLLLPSTTETLVFLIMYLFVMTLQIFLPSYLGTQLMYESQGFAFAAYNSEWMHRSEPFKGSLKLFMERAKVPIMISGLKMFPLSLVTFTSIMKTAYSFFTLIRNVQDKQE